MNDVHPPITAVRAVVTCALDEDLGPLGDITAALVTVDPLTSAQLVPREEGVLAGRSCVTETYAQIDPSVRVVWAADDGDEIDAGKPFARVDGPLSSLITGERTALNLVCHLSGVATLTRRYVRTARGRARIRDTRKTTPGLRALEKAAVRAGGGANHRGSLSDGVLVKDNHLAGLSITEAVRRAHLRWPGRAVQVECDTMEQVDQALEAGAELIMCDNMRPEQVALCVERVAGRALVEVSGGVSLDSIGAYCDAGADLISVGAITHSAPILDIGLDIDLGVR